MKRKVSKAQVKTKAGIQIIIGPGRITLVNLQRATKQYIELSPDQARALGMEKEALFAERWGADDSTSG